jgi:photosystem II protein
MLGFGSSLIGEVLSGKGALAQLGYDIGLPTPTVAVALGGLIAFNLVAAFLPGAATDSAPVSTSKADSKAAVGSKGSLLQRNPLGVTSPGFTAPNELFVGRLAALGFLASVVGELVTGQGPLAQFGLETGIPLMDTEAGLLALIGLMLFTAVGPRPRDA